MICWTITHLNGGSFYSSSKFDFGILVSFHEMDDKGESFTKQQSSTTSPIILDPPNDSTTQTLQPQQQDQDDHQEHHLKRPRIDTSGNLWKLLPSPCPQYQKQQQDHHHSSSSSPPTRSLSPSLSNTQSQTQSQLRKGKYVSPVWKPVEMLWLARAWRAQYQWQQHHQQQQGGGISSDAATETSGKSRTRADKDREVAEFLQINGVARDAKTAGTKWDNMLGEFRKVYEWEKGGEREQNGMKSYFRLSPYERKVHRLPASFDEEVYNELSQFMGFRIRASSQTFRGGTTSPNYHSPLALTVVKLLPPPPPPPPPPLPPPPSLTGRGKQVMDDNKGSLLMLGGVESSTDVASTPSTSLSSPVRRIGRIRMTWEESICLWSDESDQNHMRGRVKVEGLNFLKADELTFLDDSMASCTLEAFEEDGPLKGFSVDKFVCGQQVKVFGRTKSSSSSSPSGLFHGLQLPSITSNPPWEYQDPSDYYMRCLKTPTILPNLSQLSWHLQQPPPQDLRFPLRKDVYWDLPQGKELFFTSSTQLLDCRAITFDIISPIIRSNPSITISTATSRDSYISLWDDCINRIVYKFCSLDMVIVRKPMIETQSLQDQWPNITGFVKNLCLWRGEETDRAREDYYMDDDHLPVPSSSIVEKTQWTFMDLPYILGYYAVGYSVTFCALSRSQNHVVRTELYSVDLSTPAGRLKALTPCWRIAGILSLLGQRCTDQSYSDFERVDLGEGNIVETTSNTVKRSFSSRRKWSSVKEIYDFLDHRIPHAEYIFKASEKDLSLTFKPRGYKSKILNCEELVEVLKYVTKALVALHDLSFMHRDLSWNKVMRSSERERDWFVLGFDEAVGAPQIYPHGGVGVVGAPPEMGRGLHGVKVDVWGVGQLVQTCGLVGVPKLLRELQNRCLDLNPELRPTAADCYHHLLQLQSSISAATSGGC
ncbi:hypothetical protein GIB67_019027 [Kingdonia uniflora]|uniref:Protein kinase domain-containing protein n=1 Tax=Kingdonia uniflora TaxID=39325 RepID=A0A7J7MZZ4_9MAGN|nr:hypothetical protein GIB67_019027 [Kingdonia uniflora]